MNAATMMELDSSVWNTTNPANCLCRGSGWFGSDFDTFHKCQAHFLGQPHPEYDCDDDTFDYEAARLTNLREAYRAFSREAGIYQPDFNEMVRARVGEENRIQDWVDVAEEFAAEATHKALEARAHAAGYSCRLEAAWAAEGALEADARARNEDPEVYAPYGSPEAADRDSWYPRGL